MRAGDNVYWLFSTSLEVIATFVGLLAAGFFFFHSRIDDLVKKDETLLEIYVEIKRQIYRRFKALFILTGLSIGLGMLILYLNAFIDNVGWHLFVVLVGSLNIFTIAWAGRFFIFIVDPDIISHTAQKLVTENNDIFNKQKGDNITQKEFNDKYAELNTILRSIAAKALIAKAGEAFIPFAEVVKDLSEKGIINQEQARELSQINKARNISAHSVVDFIQGDIGLSADKLNHELQIIDEKDNEKKE